MKRCIYLFNIETGEKAEQVDVSDMKEREIIKLEQQMWAKVDDPWVVKDSKNTVD